MNIEFLSAAETNKGKYKELVVTYRNLDQDKVESKKILSFTYPEVYHALSSSAKQGNQFDVKNVKNDKGFWEWQELKAIKEGEVPQERQAPVAAAPQRPQRTEGQWETREERQARQHYIVRQSSISAALEYFKLVGRTDVSPNDICAHAEIFHDYVFGRQVEESIRSMPDDVPN